MKHKQPNFVIKQNNKGIIKEQNTKPKLPFFGPTRDPKAYKVVILSLNKFENTVNSKIKEEFMTFTLDKKNLVELFISNQRTPIKNGLVDILHTINSHEVFKQFLSYALSEEDMKRFLNVNLGFNKYCLRAIILNIGQSIIGDTYPTENLFKKQQDYLAYLGNIIANSNVLQNPLAIEFMINSIRYIKLKDDKKINNLEINKTFENLESDKYKNIMLQLHAYIDTFINESEKIFRTAYICNFKPTLSLITSILFTIDSNRYEYYKKVLNKSIDKNLSAITYYTDFQHALALIRIHMFGEREEQLSPLFTSEQKNQIKGYLEELNQLLMLAAHLPRFIIISKLNQEYFFDFSYMPQDCTIINHSKERFFGQALSKNTYSRLLVYLGTMTNKLVNEIAKTMP